MKRSSQFRLIVDAILEGFVALAVALLVLDVLWGVFTRYLLGAPSRWTEEVAQYLLMWVALFGAAAAFGRGEHLGFDYVVQKLSPSAGHLARIVSHVVVILFVAMVMVVGGFRLAADTFMSAQLTPALELNKGLVYLALPLSGCFALYYEAASLWSIIRRQPVAARSSIDSRQATPRS